MMPINIVSKEDDPKEIDENFYQNIALNNINNIKNILKKIKKLKTYSLN